MASRPPASGAKRSWREPPRGAATPKSTGSKAPQRWLLAILLVGLLAGFGWIVRRTISAPPTTYFVALLTGETDLLSTPPILFEQQTVAPLRRLTNFSDTFRFEDASSTQSEGDVDAIASKLADLAIGGDDRLILYVSAHGVSDDGVPYVLAPDYNLESPSEGRYSANDLIDAVARLNIGSKLLAFDCSRIAVHPRMGMAANEFASLVEKKSREVNDPRLTILLAGQELATSPLGLAERRAVLGGALVDALMGEADSAEFGSNNDRDLTLGELRSFVAGRCAAARVAAPAPRLLGCGPDTKRRDVDRQVILRLASGREMRNLAESIKAAVAPAKSKGGGTAGAAATAGDQPTNPAPPIAAANPAAAPTNAAVTAPAGGALPTPTPTASQGGDQPSTVEATATAAAAATTPAGGGSAAPAPATADATPAPAPPSDGAATAADATVPPAPAPTTAKRPDPITAPGAAAAEPTPPSKKPPAIIQAWLLRDQLDELTTEPREKTGPVDYAPQLWNELNAMLVAFHLEQLGRSAGAAAPPPADDKILANIKGLLQLRDDDDGPGTGSQITERIGQARLQYLSSPARQKMQQLDGRYVDAAVDFRRYLVRANQFIEWHAAMMGASGGSDATATTTRGIRELLTALDRLNDGLTEFEGSKFNSWEDARNALQELDDRRLAVRRAAEELAGQVSRTVNAIASSPGAEAEREAESLLATSVATADQRNALLKSVGNARGKGAEGERASPTWDAILEHLQLEVQLVQLVDPATKQSAPLKTVLSIPVGNGADSDEQRQAARAAGRALGDFYAALPVRIEQLRNSTRGGDDARTAERMIAVMHPRDVRDGFDATIGFIDPRLDPPSEIVLAAPADPVNISDRQATTVAWQLQLRNVPGAAVYATLGDFDSSVLDVRFKGDANEARPNVPRTFAASDDMTIALEVRAKLRPNAAAGARTMPLTLHVRVATATRDVERASAVAVRIPRPDRIDLVAYTVQPRLMHEEQPRTNSVELHPYPYRDTKFVLGLVNYGDESKDLTVRLVAVPRLVKPDDPLFKGGWPPGRVFNLDGKIPPQLESWVDTEVATAPAIATGELMNLPADQKWRQVILKAPKAEAPPAPPAADGTAAAPPPQPKPVPVTDGLVCVITDAAHPDEPMVKWLEMVPLRATSYCEFEPSPVTSEFSFTVRPTDANQDGVRDLPPEIATPVTFQIWGDDTVFRRGPAVSDEFTAAKPEAYLEIQPQAGLRGRKTVAIDVDDVPRAAIWTVDFDQGLILPDDARASIRLMQVGMPAVEGTAARLYRTTPYIDHPKLDEKAWPMVIDVGDDRVVAFDVSQGVRPKLALRLQVDAPVEAFNFVGDGSAVVVSWSSDAGEDYNLYYDRDITSDLTSVTEAGELVIKSTIKDFEFNLDAPSVNNKVVTLSSTLFVHGRAADEDSLKIVFDQNPPKIESLFTSQKVLIGRDADIQLDVSELSGVERVEAWFASARPRGPEELDPKAAQQLAIPNRAPIQPEVETSQRFVLRAAPPQMPGNYYLILRVTDRSGQTSDTLREVHLIEVAAPPKVVEGPLVADLKGRVVLAPGNKPAAGVTVAVEGTSLSATTNAKGEFVIPQLQAGEKYKLIVEGFITAPVKGELEVTPKVRADYEWKVVISAKLDRGNPPPKEGQ